MKAFFITIPHSGEQIPKETPWLQGLSEPHLMRDVDRYVDLLYRPCLEAMSLPSVISCWHRYVIDLNRKTTDIDRDSVEGSEKPSGSHPTGLHWSVTTQNEPLIKEPMSFQLHEQLVESYYQPWHRKVRDLYAQFKKDGAPKVYQLDAHSMPSLGTDKHRDPGEQRAEVVISDGDGVSCEESYKDLVMTSYAEAGFEVAYNWPYKGGGVTQTYGRPNEGQHCIQVELNRRVYMDEESKKLIREKANEVQVKIQKAVSAIYTQLHA